MKRVTGRARSFTHPHTVSGRRGAARAVLSLFTPGKDLMQERNEREIEVQTSPLPNRVPP